MKKLLLGSTAFAALAGAIFLTHGPALAVSPDDLDREKAQLQKENADLRELLRMRDENAALRARLQVDGSAPPASAPSRWQAAAPVARATSPSQAPRAELVHGVPPAALKNLYDAEMSVPVYKASPPPIAYYNWTGFYVGGNIGYSVGNDRIGQTLAVPATGFTDVNFADGVVAPKGVLGGVQLGYNWQGGRNWLTGVEFDFQGASQQDKACGSLTCETASQAGTPLQETLNVEQKLQYFGTARARLGVVDDNVLFYVTGGGAYGRVNETTNVILNVGAGASATFASSQITDNRFGWVAGAGIEAALWGNWTAKVEYLYMNLGNLAANTSAVAVPGAPPIPATLTTTSSIRDNIVRAGVNYRFGPEMTGGGLYDSVPAPYAPAVYRWTGVYVGGNIGYAQGDNRIAQTAVETVPPIVAGASDNSVITPKGFAGGLQVGYNWQGGANWLAGFEADIQGTNQSDTACTPIFCVSQTNPTGGGNEAITAKQTIDYFATMRGRLGLVNNNILFYGTGGVALGHVNETVAINDTLIAPASFNTSSTSADLIGWVVGGGIEAAVSGNWTAKAEYLYMDLGSISNTLAVPSQTTTFMTSSTVKDHIFRVGANYHL
jgi:outer membrane immunogenic protein